MFSDTLSDDKILDAERSTASSEIQGAASVPNKVIEFNALLI